MRELSPREGAFDKSIEVFMIVEPLKNMFLIISLKTRLEPYNCHKHFTGIMNYLVLSFYPSPNPFICLTVSLFPDIDYCSFQYSFLAVEKKKTKKQSKQTNTKTSKRKRKFQFVMHTFGSLSHTNHDHQDNEVNCYQSLHYEKTK